MIGGANLFAAGGSSQGVINAWAVIKAKYPAGSVCTCTNGEKTFKTKDASGEVIFGIPAAGDWTVSCTNGEKTSTKTVTITEQYQVENVKLGYGWHLFKEGVGMAEEATYRLTNSYPASQISITPERIRLVNNSNFSAADVYFYPAGYSSSDALISMDIAEYSTINAEVQIEWSSVPSTSSTFHARMGSRVGDGTPWTVVNAQEDVYTPGGEYVQDRFILSVDTSNASRWKETYFYLATSGYCKYFYIYNIWVE